MYCKYEYSVVPRGRERGGVEQGDTCIKGTVSGFKLTWLLKIVGSYLTTCMYAI